jgi:hypothetical protein
MLFRHSSGQTQKKTCNSTQLNSTVTQTEWLVIMMRFKPPTFRIQAPCKNKSSAAISWSIKSADAFSVVFAGTRRLRPPLDTLLCTLAAASFDVLFKRGAKSAQNSSVQAGACSGTIVYNNVLTLALYKHCLPLEKRDNYLQLSVHINSV